MDARTYLSVALEGFVGGRLLPLEPSLYIIDHVYFVYIDAARGTALSPPVILTRVYYWYPLGRIVRPMSACVYRHQAAER